jgi:hypothetical protein
MHSPSPRACYMPCPSHHHLHEYLNYTWRRVQTTKLVLNQFSSASYYFIPPDILLNNLFSNTPNVCSSSDVRDLSLHTVGMELDLNGLPNNVIHLLGRSGEDGGIVKLNAVFSHG